MFDTRRQHEISLTFVGELLAEWRDLYERAEERFQALPEPMQSKVRTTASSDHRMAIGDLLASLVLMHPDARAYQQAILESGSAAVSALAAGRDLPHTTTADAQPMTELTNLELTTRLVALEDALKGAAAWLGESVS